MASPVPRALKEGLESPEIHWLIDPSLAPLLEANPYVDELILWDKARWNNLSKHLKFYSLLKEIGRFRANLNKKGYDMALDLQGLLRSRILAYLSGSRERIGFTSKEPGGILMTRLVSKGPDSTLMGSEYLHLMKEMDIEVKDPAPRLFIKKETISRTEEILEQKGIRRPFFTFAPFTTRPQKHWILERWRLLAQEIHRHFGLPVVILGGPKDKGMAEHIIGNNDSIMKHLCSQATIMESAAVISMSQALIGVDTGLTHMGTALKRPTIALFGATCPYLDTPLQTTRVIYHKHPCSPCKRRPTCGDFPCMAEIGEDEILKELKKLL